MSLVCPPDQLFNSCSYTSPVGITGFLIKVTYVWNVSLSTNDNVVGSLHD